MSSENPRPEHQCLAGARPRQRCHYGVLSLCCLHFAFLVLCGSLGFCDTNAVAQAERPLATAAGEQAALTTTSEAALNIDQSQQGKELAAENQKNTNKNKKEPRGAIVVAPIPLSSPAIGSGVVQLNQVFDDSAKKLNRPMDSLEFYRILAPVVAEIKCGHTAAFPPKDIRQAIEQTAALLPLDVEVLSGKVYVVREYSNDDEQLAGLEIRRINKVGIDWILSTILAGTRGDADSHTGRQCRIAHEDPFTFAEALYSLLGIQAPFQIEFLNPKTGRKKTMTLAGVTFPDREKVASIRYPQDKKSENNASLKFLDSDKIAVLTVSAFFDKKGQKPLSTYFVDAFQQIHDQQSKSLIIDVRNNGGGYDNLGKELLSFLLAEPFQYYDDLIYNAREFDFFRYADGAQPIPAERVEKRADGKFHDIKHVNLGIQQPSLPHFAGKVVVLMNGGSFSTTCEFLSNLHYRKRATFVGEEAAGGYYGNTSGYAVWLTLPNSKVQMIVPLRTYYLAVKDGDPNRSILPDYEVKPSIDDILSGNDVIMAKAIKLARM